MFRQTNAIPFTVSFRIYGKQRMGFSVYIFVYKSNPRNKCLYPNLTVCNYVKRGKYIRIQLLLTYKDA